MKVDELLTPVSLLIKEVGSWILDQRLSFTSNDIEEKSLNNLVSYVDKTAETKLVIGLKNILPGSKFLTEEGTVEYEPGEWEWIIDPLDGTTNFIHGIPVYCISVALRQNQEIVLGVIYDPNHQECFTAIKHQGAKLNGQAIHVSPAPSLASSLIATGFPHRNFDGMGAYVQSLEYFFYRTRGLRRMGSAAIDLAYVACGRMDGFFELKLNPWDIAAGVLLITEAGGLVSDFEGNPDFLFKSELLAGNPAVYQDMKVVLNKYFNK